MFKAKNFAAALNSEAAGMVFVTHRLIPDLDRRPNLLLLRPRDLVVGIGCNRGTAAEEIEAVLTEVLHRAFLSPASVACLVITSYSIHYTKLYEVIGQPGVAGRTQTRCRVV